MRLNIPTILTFLRIALIPVFVVAYYLPYAWAPFAAALIFVIAGATDWLDGYLARRLKQSTRFGAFLDPVADKVMVAIAMVLIVEHYASIWITIPAATMIAREVIISALREWMAEIGKRASVAVSWVGKFKTGSQMFALTMLLWHGAPWIEWLGYIALYAAAGLTYWSMYQYMMAAKDDLLADPEDE
ncbi:MULTISPECIES: CDP-diacylglycerol--glycerol-3-phosphate 3-phosphatidyltransferase [Salinivibrio]|uniref:CDP-diacylglycerol--glycerol-3-phosphate 3-phosphatidyltransferase n=3 Tax=Salinivibrio TaxID=51366 RepID=A0AA47LQH0_9GAMM|nr:MULTISPECIES: CDP-diacylglycerol--glycerol-3-phosphate 3-phosphatidyltransferase [Salinivibrio]OOE83840.1 CDP-diacylglycerol--glycerol-3-phosphate 3-phosphatidyltransferase [Salinivibrio siamensis]OOE88521.1 CDP-diacylglycerol--glycerol-3-phosphate 3-phosphatidyltransferase [Salinivibrio sharmensis]WBA07680.1 CDP-diacylglycerol--glycerol-3-phosphate 3-phosphatidyltransferase [Salinivibrio kushneri]